MNQYVFLLIGYFLIKPHQSQQPGAAAVQLQRTWFVWTWTGGRCPVLHLTTYKGEQEEKTPRSFCIIQCGVRCWLRCYVSWDIGITDPLHIFAFSYNVYVYLHNIIIIIINNIVIRLFKDLNFCQPTFLVFFHKMLFSIFWFNCICLHLVYIWNFVKHVISPKIACNMYSVLWNNYICLAAAMFPVKIYMATI